MKKLLFILLLLIVSCAGPKDENYLGYVEKLPKGEYIIYNWGSRHMVRCERADGKYYIINDADFSINNIKGHDASQYYDKTRIKIK